MKKVLILGGSSDIGVEVVKNFLDISTCAKSIERIGDHAKNIAQHTVYLIKGKDIRHTSVEQVRSELDDA